MGEGVGDAGTKKGMLTTKNEQYWSNEINTEVFDCKYIDIHH